MEFKFRLRDLRREKNVTGEELGKIVGVGKNAIYHWENGRNYPNNQTLEKIANYFEVSVDYLLGRTDIPNQTKIENITEEEANFRYALFSEAKELSKDQKRQLLNMAKFLRSQKE